MAGLGRLQPADCQAPARSSGLRQAGEIVKPIGRSSSIGKNYLTTRAGIGRESCCLNTTMRLVCIENSWHHPRILLLFVCVIPTRQKGNRIMSQKSRNVPHPPLFPPRPLMVPEFRFSL